MQVIALLAVAAIALIAIAVPLFILRSNKPQISILGLSFYLPQKIGDGVLDVNEIEKFIFEYAKVMPSAFKDIGITVTDHELFSHISTIQCTMRPGFLNNMVTPALRARSGMLALNGDVANSVTGLTIDYNVIEVAVVKSLGMLKDNRIQIGRTALFYEVHNACVWRFAGYAHAICESFVSPSDAAIAKAIAPLRIVDVQARRLILDSQFETLKSVTA